MKKIVGLVFVLFLVVSSAFSAEVEEVLKRVKANYSTDQTYGVKTHYELFKGHHTKDLTESYSGYLENTSFGFYQKIQQTERFMTDDYFLHISHDEKAMVFGLPVERSFNEDISEALKKISVKKVEESEKYYTVMLYFLGFTQVEYSSIVLVVDKENYLLKSVDIYYATFRNFAKRFSDKDVHQPHLRIKYSNYSKNIKVNTDRFKLSNFLKKVNGLLEPQNEVSDYELIDIRTQQN